MPRVKIAYVVSFSSEDPEHRAENLLSLEVSKKKWLCSHWEPSCSVVLQLERAVEISAIQIGAHNASLVEVLMGLSERPNDPFQVVVPSCVFQPAAEARRGAAPDRVRCFARAELAARGRADRLRVVCSQPYNKHCKYGLSFIHVHEAEPQIARLLAPDAASSDEEEFRPGELFARRHLQPSASLNTTTSAQINQATSQALKNVSESSTKLVKTAINSPASSRQKQTDGVHTDRRKDSLMYTDDDDKPHDKIDRIVNRHKNERNKEDELNKAKHVEKDKGKLNSNNSHHDNNTKIDTNTKAHKDVGDQNSKNNKRPLGRDNTSNTEKDKPKEAVQRKDKDAENKKIQERDQEDKTGAGGGVCAEREVLAGVQLALSGYAGARRAALRALALRLGARYAADWGPRCTHLVCAFPNTPKLRAVRAASRSAGVATAEWLEACAARRRHLPWQWFATLPAERVPAAPLDDPPDTTTATTKNKRDLSDEDTDDEIERHLSAKKKAKTGSPRSSPTNKTTGGATSGVTSGAGSGAAGDASSDDDVAFVRDERFLAHVTLDSDADGDATDCDTPPTEERIDPSKALPDFFDGYTFVILDDVGEKLDIEQLTRYVRAFGGLVLPKSAAAHDADYVVGAARARWLRRCAAARRLLPAPTD